MNSVVRALRTHAKSLLVLPFLTLPMGAHASKGEIMVGAAGGAMVTDPLEVLGPAWYVTPRVGYFFDDNIGVELDVGFQGGKTRIGEFPYTALTPRVNMIGRLWSQGRRRPDGTMSKPAPVQPLLAMGLGAWYKNTNDDNALGQVYNRKDLDFLANAGPGVLVPIGPAHLRTDLRWVVSLGNENFQNRGDQFISWEWTAGIGFSFGGETDKDDDGILDDDDQCVDEPEDRDEFEDADGCPDPDNDGDGVADGDDKCPNDAEDDDDFEDADGCPDPDNDKDEIPDTEDECPLVAGHKSAKGCPDQDGDGVVDDDDECPDEAGEAKAFGCPDSDEDRVPTYRDECPDEPAPPMIDPRRSNGCPAKVFVTEKAIQITEKIFFDVDKATIKKKSHPLLDEIAGTLEKYPAIKKVSIEGHTDNTGDAGYNKTLSDERAKSVMAYLVEKGIDASRLDAKGYGMEKPLVDGDAANTEEGRAQNRRVEFNITEQDEAQQQVFKRPTLQLTDPEEGAVKIDGIVAKTTPMPSKGFVTTDVVCEAKIVIEVDGTVSKVRMNKECIGLARYATRAALSKWTFEPFELDGKPSKAAATFKVTYKEGAATVVHDAKALKPIQE